jgi:tetrahydromethanopterin S-methyltransferase subunit A
MKPAVEKNAVGQIVDELQAATAAAKCHKCGCFHGALQQLARALPSLPPDVQAEITQVLEAGAAGAIPEEYACLGCAVCWPANALNLAAQAFPDATLATEAACPTDIPAAALGWPPLPGNYRVLDAGGVIGVCVLTSEGLVADIASAQPAGVAIVGTLFTENLGIERIITNTLANPNVMTLLVCGADSQQRIGHRPGQTLLSLMAHGIDERRRVIGAEGRRPFVKNLSLEAIDAFRREITVVDRVGEVDAAAILDLLRRSSVHRETRPTPTGRVAGKVAGNVEGPTPVRAQPPEQLVLDPKGYVVLFPDRGRGLIRVEHYETDGRLAHVFEGTRSDELYSTIIARGLVSRLDHAAYLGQELARVQRALACGEAYVQDQAPEPSCDQGCAGSEQLSARDEPPPARELS